MRSGKFNRTENPFFFLYKDLQECVCVYETEASTYMHNRWSLVTGFNMYPMETRVLGVYVRFSITYIKYGLNYARRAHARLSTLTNYTITRMYACRHEHTVQFEGGCHMHTCINQNQMKQIEIDSLNCTQILIAIDFSVCNVHIQTMIIIMNNEHGWQSQCLQLKKAIKYF